MNSKTTARFRNHLQLLPSDIRFLALARYRQWLKDPFAPSFHFKEIRTPLWSVRINQNYRALAKRYGDLIVWFWIGSHADYDRLIK